jgi:hypothetical protein
MKNLWGSLVETRKFVYVKVDDKQALSKEVVVWLEDGGGLESELDFGPILYDMSTERGKASNGIMGSYSKVLNYAFLKVVCS